MALPARRLAETLGVSLRTYSLSRCRRSAGFKMCRSRGRGRCWLFAAGGLGHSAVDVHPRRTRGTRGRHALRARFGGERLTRSNGGCAAEDRKGRHRHRNCVRARRALAHSCAAAPRSHRGEWRGRPPACSDLERPRVLRLDYRDDKKSCQPSDGRAAVPGVLGVHGRLAAWCWKAIDFRRISAPIASRTSRRPARPSSRTKRAQTGRLSALGRRQIPTDFRRTSWR